MKGIHPLFLLMAVIGIVSGLYTLYDRAPALMPILFAASLLGILFRSIALAKEQRRERSPAAAVRFQYLRSIDLVRYAPWLKENLRGHDPVIDRVVGRIQNKLFLASSQDTLGNFLLVGPTGTGKTFLGELLARALYPASEAVVLRMNQYTTPQDVSTLLGPPPGHMGHELGGTLIRPVIENPYRVIILDEFDKAHPDIQRCFYDILDTARCREKSSGRTVYFNACVFLATCNAGTEPFSAKSLNADLFSRSVFLREALSHEGLDKALLARFDDILMMDELRPLDAAEVACLQLCKHWRRYGIEVQYASPELLLDTVRRNAPLREYGVRDLARVVQEMTAPAIAVAWRSGARRVRLDLDHATKRVKVEAA